nr:uncharacterized protein LOC102412845 isoform X2 [Bubalus bubalis]
MGEPTAGWGGDGGVRQHGQASPKEATPAPPREEGGGAQRLREPTTVTSWDSAEEHWQGGLAGGCTPPPTAPFSAPSLPQTRADPGTLNARPDLRISDLKASRLSHVRGNPAPNPGWLREAGCVRGHARGTSTPQAPDSPGPGALAPS